VLPWAHLHNLDEFGLHQSLIIDLRQKASEVVADQGRFVARGRVQSREGQPLNSLMERFSGTTSSEAEEGHYQIRIHNEGQEFDNHRSQ
jgi:hypothetical protein